VATIPIGSIVDRSVQRLDTAYDTQGNAYLFTSYADTMGTMMVNQVQRSFNGFGQLTAETQVHPAGQSTVQYTYSNMLDSQGNYANHSRPTGIVYPNARSVSYSYGALGSLDDTISRLDAVVDQTRAGPTLEALTFLGLNTVVKRSHPETNLTLSYINQPGGSSDGGDQYTGLDRFGRVVDQYWSVGATATDSFQYAYDRDSNPLTQTNSVNGAFSEQFGYDNLNRLTSFAQGAHMQSWMLDAEGNWTSFQNDTTTQTRTHNAQNQIATLTQPGLNTPTYDANGNARTDEFGDGFVYDAWNRLVSVTAGANTYRYSYDTMGRRITSQLNAGPVTDLYYSSSWQVVEERVNGAMTTQYVWSPVYVDAMIERDTAGMSVPSDRALISGQRLYVEQDAHWNVTALVDTTGTVQERYTYDPYGKATVRDPVTWQVRGGGTYGTRNFAWLYLHQGGRYERYSDAAGMYLFRNRDYSPTLGRWLQQDPAGYAAGGSNLYQYVSSRPTVATDPSGEIGWVWIIAGGIAGVKAGWAAGQKRNEDPCDYEGALKAAGAELAKVFFVMAAYEVALGSIAVTGPLLGNGVVAILVEWATIGTAMALVDQFDRAVTNWENGEPLSKGLGKLSDMFSAALMGIAIHSVLSLFVEVAPLRAEAEAATGGAAAPSNVDALMTGRRGGTVISEARFAELQQLYRDEYNVILWMDTERRVLQPGEAALYRAYANGPSFMYVGAGVTEYELAHESFHMFHHQALGEGYFMSNLSFDAANLIREQYVFDQMIESSVWNSLTRAEQQHAINYIRGWGGNPRGMVPRGAQR
jgi:RHS repeat-associated protein